MSRVRVAAAAAAAAAVALTFVPATSALAAAAPAPVIAHPPTTISLTFDDANADQLTALALLKQSGMTGTFFIPSGFVGTPGHLGRADLSTIAAAGDEIGGHTVDHPDLATLPSDEILREVCTDRDTLLGWGFAVRSFAYPFASASSTAEADVRACGYASARGLGDIASRFGCAGCGAAETLPPADPYYTRALDETDATWTLADLQGAVQRAERNGGWLQFTFHHVCAAGAGCDLNITPTLLAQFLAWLKPRAASGTVVRTVGDAIGGPVQPAVAPPAAAASPTGVVNPSLELLGTNGVPTCWMQAGYGTNAAQFSLTTGHAGAVASRITMSSYTSGDAKLLQAFDLGTCAPSVTVGRTYALGEWYTSNVVTQFAVYLRSTSGSWQYWTSSPWFAPSASWAQAAWTTPAVPAGFTGISFGLNIFGTGVLTVDDAAMTTGAAAVANATPQG